MKETGTTAVVTCHNYAGYLADCLDSLLRQTLPFDEIILVDDASSDGTHGVWLSRYQDKVRYERIEARDPMAARNHGVNLAQGEFLVCVDADDWLSPFYHEKLSAALSRDPRLAIAYCGMHLVREGQQSWFSPKEHPMIPFHRELLKVHNFIPSEALLRRQVWRGAKRAYGALLPDGRRYGEDWDHWLEIVREGWRVELVPEHLVYYRLHGRNLSREAYRHRKILEACQWEIRRRHLAHDLAVLVAGAPDDARLTGLLTELENLRKPASARVVLVDGTPSPERSHLVRVHGFAYRSLAFPPEGQSQAWRREAWREAGLAANARELLLLDAQILVPAGLYEALARGKSAKRAHFYAARVISEALHSSSAWRFSQSHADEGFKLVPVIRRPKRVAGTSFHAVLVSGEAFYGMPFEGGGEYASLEFEVSAWARERGFRWFVDGNVRCARLRPDGKAMRIGRTAWRPAVEALVPNSLPAFPPISLLLPARDAGDSSKLARECLRSLRYPEERLEVLELPPGMNRAQARNAVLGKARHSWIAFVSERGPFAPDWLAAAGRCFEADANVACVLTPLLCPPGGDASSSVALPFAAGCHALYRKEVFASLGEFDPELEQDMDLDMIYRLSDKGLETWAILNLRQQGMDRMLRTGGSVPWWHQAHKLGERHARLYRKHPQRLPRLYFWMPDSSFELILQAVRRFFAPQSLAVLGFNAKLSLREKASLLLFLTACSHAYRKTLSSIRLEKAARRTCFLFLGRRHTEPGQDLFKYLWDLAQGGDTAIHVANSISPLISWKEFLTRLFGSPGFWTWKGEFVSMSAWRLRPRGRDRRAQESPSGCNVRRIRGLLGAWEISSGVILGELGPAELAAWRRELAEACPRVEWHNGTATPRSAERSLENATV